MNLNPDDGHIMDYTTGWDDGDNIGYSSTAFVKDYLSSEVWGMAVNSIAIVRHQKVGKKKDFLFQLRNHTFIKGRIKNICGCVSSHTYRTFLN